MIDVETAAELLDFGGRVPAEFAREQLQGAVALHNVLDRKGIAYLADEVGMGKTLVALGAVALFRHFNPSFRVLIIAPRENIQRKWEKEMRAFVRNVVRFPDLRNKSLQGEPARAIFQCRNLVDLVRETSLDPDRDFVARLTSFSLQLKDDPKAWKRLRDELRSHLPWLPGDELAGRGKRDFKEAVARAACCALPEFDLVIVDEAHALKAGFSEGSSDRNRLLGLVLGHAGGVPGGAMASRYRPRARRVLLLSATPLEHDLRQIWNQLDVLGHGQGALPLASADPREAEARRESLESFLIRRVTGLEVSGRRLTKNLYRREFRKGGVRREDEPLERPGDLQRLVVALVQKKVSEILGGERFNNRFQIGMLASFESFLQTAGVEQDGGEPAAFDASDQSKSDEERAGVDVGAVNALADDFRRRFLREMPHPKMDAVVAALAEQMQRGTKALVFVRRVASVDEICRKLEERWDAALFARLKAELDPALHERFDAVASDYRREKERRERARLKSLESEPATGESPLDPDDEPDDDASLQADPGGFETFFAWFFRGEGPKGVLSGARLQRRFVQPGAALSTFFEENHVAAVLGCAPDDVASRLCEAVGASAEEVATRVRERAAARLRATRRPRRRDQFTAAQHAALELLASRGDAVAREAAVLVLREWPVAEERRPMTPEAIPDPMPWLACRTFWTELRRRPALRARLWPEPGCRDAREAFRERELRRVLLATQARLGQPLIDLWLLLVRELGSLEGGAERVESGEDSAAERLADLWLDRLEQQAAGDAPAFRELADAADQFGLVLDLNAPEVRAKRLDEAATIFARLLGEQQPVGGVSGHVNQTLVKQFRMPGFPHVLVSTEVLQEGEDLHAFCSNVVHYGIAWTPSAMEQRVGRVDRARSATERRLKRIDEMGADPAGDDLIQVWYPHLRDTVEALQVETVLERMNRFLRLLHRGLGPAEVYEPTCSIGDELRRDVRDIAPIRDVLVSAYPVRDAMLAAPPADLAVTPEEAKALAARFARLHGLKLDGLEVRWLAPAVGAPLQGIVRMGTRSQLIELSLRSFAGRALVRCRSVLDDRAEELDAEDLDGLAAELGTRSVVLVASPRLGGTCLTVEADVLLSEPEHDAERVARFLERVAFHADALEQGLFEEDVDTEDHRSALGPEDSDGR